MIYLEGILVQTILTVGSGYSKSICDFLVRFHHLIIVSLYIISSSPSLNLMASLISSDLCVKLESRHRTLNGYP